MRSIQHPLQVLDQLLQHNLLAASDTKYPPANIYKKDDCMFLEMSVAGFSKDELSVSFDGQKLTISGAKESGEADLIYITRELGQRDFSRTFVVGNHYVPQSPVISNGIMTISFKCTYQATKLEITSLDEVVTKPSKKVLQAA